MCSELAVLEELLILNKFFVKDTAVNVLVVLVLARVDNCLKLSEVLSAEHLLAKLWEFLNPLLTQLCLKIQEVQNAEVDVVFDNNVEILLEFGCIARVRVKLRYVIGSFRVGYFDH